MLILKGKFTRQIIMRPVPTELISKPLPETPPARPIRALTAFQFPAYRYFFGGQIISLTGTWVQNVAQQIVVYQMTGSELALGLVACAQGLPAFILAPVSGVIAERFSRRHILIGTQITMMLMALIMALLHFSGVLQIWHVMLLSIGLGVANALDAPARLAFISEMVGKEALPSGIVLNSIMFNAARIIGPAFGGLVLRWVGPSWCFLFNGLSFLAVIAGLILMHLTPLPHKRATTSVITQFREGLSFSRFHPEIAPLLILSALSSTFGMTFSILIPSFADQVLKNTIDGTSALLTVQGLGAFAGALFIGRITGLGFRGRVLAFGATVGPASVILMSFTQSFGLVVVWMGMAGFAFVCQYVLMNTLLQTVVPDEFRGRVMSLYSVTFFGLTPFGSLLIGAMGQAIGTTTTMLVFGAIGLTGSLIVLKRAPQVMRMP